MSIPEQLLAPGAVAGATPARPRVYTRTAVVLHWLVTVLVLTGASVGVYMVNMHFSPLRVRLFNYHKWIGITVLGLAVVRSLWRLTHPAPPAEPMPAWQRAAANVSHALLYAFILVVPLAGWAYSSAAGFPIVYLKLLRLPNLTPRDPSLAAVLVKVHVVLAFSLIAVVAVHAAAALKHHFIDRDATLRRMWQWRRS